MDESEKKKIERKVMASLPGFSEILEEKRHEDILEIQDNHHKEILKIQNEFNNKSLEKQEKQNKLTKYLVSITFFALIISSLFSYLENKREQDDLELRIRPYLTIEETKYQLMNNSNKTMEYIFIIKNSGILPARLLDIESSVKSPNKKEQSELINQKEARRSGSIISPQGTMDYKFKVEWLSSRNITNPLERPEVTFTLRYKAALEEFQDKEYVTWESYWMDLNEMPEIIGGSMQ